MPAQLRGERRHIRRLTRRSIRIRLAARNARAGNADRYTHQPSAIHGAPEPPITWED